MKTGAVAESAEDAKTCVGVETLGPRALRIKKILSGCLANATSDPKAYFYFFNALVFPFSVTVYLGDTSIKK